MLRKTLFLYLIVILLPVAVWAQGSGTVSGLLTDEAGKPVADLKVYIQGTNNGSETDAKGHYSFSTAAGENLTMIIRGAGYKQMSRRLTLKSGEIKKMPTLIVEENYTVIKEVVKRNDRQKMEAGTLTIEAKAADEMPSTMGGIEGVIKSQIGSTNELTSQYSVRGGNYDENLVYVNDFEIYRPFLVRSGQQEGLSFVNADLVDRVMFSVGGFQSKYGDKMSSVLDVNYKKPDHFAGTAMVSLLGANLSLEGASKNKKLTYLFGFRQKSNQYLLQSQPTKGIYNPSFTDVQGVIDYQINSKWSLEVIANYARNRFSYFPETMTSSFGVLNKAYQLNVFYTGGEIDQFDSRFGGISTTYQPNDRLKLKFLASGFQTNERETYDISGEYRLGELETDLGKDNFGQVKNYLGTGIIQDFARNYLKVNVGTVAFKGSYVAGRHFLQWGADASAVSINDQLHQWQRRDSAGFTQPYDMNSLQMMTLYVAANNFNYYKFSGYFQDNFRFRDSVRFAGSFGVRYNYNTLNLEHLVSPRLQLGFTPTWKRDVTFRFATGLYAQPPFYRELRDLQGNVNTNVKAQKSFHVLGGTEYNFKVSNRPFRFTTELYYKKLWDLVPYEYDGIRIRYYGRNASEGYAYGAEFRLYADLVKDATSWISLGLMKTDERITTDYKNISGGDSSVTSGYIPRPTDQRLMIAMYFQDYLRQNKNFRVHINLMYGTGLPFGPADGDRTNDVLRIPAYRRVDVGFSALLLDNARRDKPAHSYFNSLKSIWASFEVFNLLDIQNTLSYTWIQDQTSGKTFAVPNRLTSRLFNVKFIVKF